MRKKPTIRLAEDFDSEDIQDILKANNLYLEGLNWQHIYPFWLIAEYDDRAVGCIMVVPGRPLGIIPYWAVLPEYHHTGVGVYLLRAAENVLFSFGISHLAGYTQFAKKWKRHYKRHGTIELGKFTVVVKAIKYEDTHTGSYRPQKWKNIKRREPRIPGANSSTKGQSA